MRRTTMWIAVLLILLAVSPTARAGILGLGIGVYGGVNAPLLDEDTSAGSVIGVKLRVAPPIPMIGFEAYYERIGQESAEDVWKQGDVGLAFNGDGFNVFGADVLIGSVRNPAGLKMYGIAGVNLVDVSEDGSEEMKLGGELGAGIEFEPPILGLGVEVRAMVMVMAWEAGPDWRVGTLTAGLNYYF
jgi:hypothetical protein